MYTKYFGFNEKPFTLTPNPRFIYLSKNHKESFAHLLYGINNHYGFIELVGEVGTGKTTVLRTLLSQLGDEHYRSALIFNPCLSGVELLRSINHEFGLCSNSEFANELLADLNRFLLEENAKGTTVILVIDEAQNLRPEVLEQLRLISNLETENDKLIQIILAGQPELEELLARPELRQLNQRIAVRYRLKSMSMDETRAYIRRRMEVAGESGGVSFSLSAIRWIYLYTRGVPRMINILCDRSLLVAYGDEKRRISSGIVTRAIREILNVPQQRNLKLALATAAAVLLVVAASAALINKIPATTNTRSPSPAATADAANKSDESAATAKRQPSAALKDLEKILAAQEQKSVHLQAINSILTLWDLQDYNAPQGALTFPDQAATLFNYRGLRLTEIRGTLHEVLNANLPFLFETRVSGKLDRYCLAITSVSADSATFRPALTKQSSISLNELDKLSSGTFYLVWNNYYQIPENIFIGDKKPEIRVLQNLLARSGTYGGAIDGIFGAASLKAVYQFQKINSIPANDTVGAQTIAYLYRYDNAGTPPRLKSR